MDIYNSLVTDELCSHIRLWLSKASLIKLISYINEDFVISIDGILVKINCNYRNSDRARAKVYQVSIVTDLTLAKFPYIYVPMYDMPCIAAYIRDALRMNPDKPLCEIHNELCEKYNYKNSLYVPDISCTHIITNGDVSLMFNNDVELCMTFKLDKYMTAKLINKTESGCTIKYTNIKTNVQYITILSSDVTNHYNMIASFTCDCNVEIDNTEDLYQNVIDMLITGCYDYYRYITLNIGDKTFNAEDKTCNNTLRRTIDMPLVDNPITTLL
jgi:hypothetical protein